MMQFLKEKRFFLVLAVLLTLAVLAVNAKPQLVAWEDDDEGMAKRRSAAPLAAVIAAKAPQSAAVPAAGPTGFTPQTRLGFDVGDQWEPAIAADKFGHVYMLYPQYYGVPGCATCGNPTMILQISSDHGSTWGAPVVMYPAGAANGQWDAQLSVDPVDGKTVYASWMQNGKSDIVVGKSTDFGATWSVVTADSANSGVDKPILVVRGQDVYVSYNHSQKIFVALSHDGGQTFTQAQVNYNGKLGWGMPGGGAVTPNGNVFFAWAGYEQNGGAKGNVNLFVTKSSDGGLTWKNTVLDISRAPERCPADYYCGWAYLGAQMVMTSDDAGNLYAMWNANSADFGPARVYFAKSTNSGASWSAKADVSTAAGGISHNFPAIAAVGNGDVRISWMDERNGWWNTYYRSSTNGGASWSAEVDISSSVPGFTYINDTGFRFPFGDYYEMDIDEQGTAHIIMGEGWSYDSPGSIWYTKGK